MEELQKKIKFNSISVKIQTGNKLAEKISSGLSTTVPLSSSKQQTPEQKLLWELCGDLDLTVSTTCCTILVSLVKRGLANHDFVIQGLLNLVPTAKNLSGICSAVCDILIIQLLSSLEKTGNYTCPYKIRDPPHPLVTIVTSRPDGWIVIQQQISRLLASQDERIAANILHLLDPSLHFILLEPAQSPQFLPLRMGLVPSLLNTARTQAELRPKIQQKLVNILAKYQLTTNQNLSEFSHHVTCLLHGYLGQQEMTSDDEKEVKKTLVSMVINFCPTGFHQGFDVSHVLELVVQLVQISPECLSLESFLDLVTLVNELSPVHVMPVLKLVRLWLQTHGGSHPVLENMVVLPIIQVTTLPPVAKKMMEPVHRPMASEIFKVLADNTAISSHQKQDSDTNPFDSLHLTPEGSSSAAFIKLSKIFSTSPAKAHKWLEDIKAVLSGVDQVPLHVTCLVASLITLCREKEVLCTALDVLVKICQVDTIQAPGMLPFLLHMINKEQDPEIKLALLHAVPKTVTHKLAIGPALHSIQILATDPKLKSVAMVMMSTLWQQHNRCFSYLQQLILDTTQRNPCPETGLDEVMIAKAKCIRDVCEHRPEQHGEDILTPLSDLINKCTSEKDAEIVVLAIEGLYFLFEEEVIDVITAWANLSGKLLKDKRPLVSAAVCRLLALIPRLEAENAENEEFKEFKTGILKILWKYSQSPNNEIACAAFQGLAKFSREDFNLTHFPEKVTEGLLKLSEDSLLDELLQDEAGGGQPESVETQEIPGLCYTRLLRILPDGVLPDYEVFLKAVVKQEVATIPRGIHHSAKRQLMSNQNKAVAAVPAFLQAEFDRNKIPGLRPSLAVGVMFSYDPPVATGKDGKPKTQQLIQLGRGYQQTLYNLIHEVPMQMGDWHQALSLPHAWLTFMDKCFSAHMEGHRFELQQHLDRGKAQDPDENQFQQQTAWLWSRDKLTDLIKSTSSGSPSAQANSVCALGGLVVAVSKHVSSLDRDQLTLADTATQHRSHSHWLSVVMETLLCILDPKYQTNSDLLEICQLRTGKDRHPSGTLARCGAGIALSFMVPILMTTNADAIYLVLDALTEGLPGASSETADKPVLLFYHSMSLGLVLARLFEEHFADTAGTRGMVAVWKALDTLEKSCLSPESNRLGGCLGLSLCLVAMCSDNKTDARVHVTTLQEKLTMALETTPVNDNAFEGICMCLSALSGTCYLCNIIGQEVVDLVVGKIYQIHCQHTQMPGVALSLGLVCNLLLQANHPTVGDLTIKLFGSWLGALSEKGLPTLQRLSYLKGALALAGSENSLYNISEGTTSSQSGISISDITKAAQQLVRDSGDIGLQSACSWQLGQLCMSAVAGGQSRLSVPMTYHYLPETSIIRALVDVLIEAGKQGSEAVAESHLESTLRVLVHGPTMPLPPLNWPGVLSPLIRMIHKSTETLSLELAVRQSAVSPSAGLLLATWILTPLWDTLKLESKTALLSSLPKLISSVPVSKLKEFLEDGFIRNFQTLSSLNEDHVDMECMRQCSSALSGLLGALQVPDPPNMITKLLYETVENVYGHMPKCLHVHLYTTMCQCLAEVPNDLVDKIIAKDFDDIQLYSKGLYVRCYLVSHGRQPLSLTNSAVEAFMCKTESDSNLCLWHLTHCFYGVHLSTAESCSATQCQTWLLELMGYIRNVATGVMPVVRLEPPQVVDFLLLVFSAAVSSWSNCASSQLLLAPVQLGSKLKSKSEDDMKLGSNSQEKTILDSLNGTGDESIDALLRSSLPLALTHLLAKQEWKLTSSKVMDWLMALHQSPPVEQTKLLQRWIKDCLYSLRHNPEMKKMAVWSKAFSLPE